MLAIDKGTDGWGSLNIRKVGKKGWASCLDIDKYVELAGSSLSFDC